jgi:hypothetical protein
MILAILARAWIAWHLTISGSRKTSSGHNIFGAELQVCQDPTRRVKVTSHTQATRYRATYRWYLATGL